MPKKFFLAALAPVVLLVLAYGMLNVKTEAAEGDFAVEMIAGRNLNSIAYNIVLKNPTSSPVRDIFVSGLVPAGTTYVANSATAGGKLSGGEVIWVVDRVPANGSVLLTYRVTAAATAVGANHAWVHWLSPKDGTAVSPDVTAEYQLIKVKGVNVRETPAQILPAGKVALTTTSGKGHQENQISTNALTNVGVGDFVYLQGAEHDSHEGEIASWSWSLQAAPAGSQAQLEQTDKEITRFIADRTGEYQVRLETTNAKGEKAASSLTVTAGEYSGMSLCASCHDGSVAKKDIVSQFVKTGHADKFETTWNSYSGSSDYCIRCHTLAYNEQANNGGMDDAARAAGWDPQSGSVLAWLKQGWTLDQVKSDPNLSQAINIQCENCHGPGKTAHTGTKSFDPGVCAQCHPQVNEWKNAGHAKVNPEMAGNANCARCHTGQGYVQEWVRGKTIVMPDQATPDKPANVPSPEQQSGISCATCHDPHAFTDRHEGANGPASMQLRLEGEVKAPAGWSVDAGLAATCVRCHANNRTEAVRSQFVAGTYVRATHENTQADVFYGKGFYDYDGAIKTSNSFHTTFEEGCITCHMAGNPVVDNGPDGVKGSRDDVKALSVGGHSWKMAGEWEGKEIENLDACSTCHAGTTTFNRAAAGDYDGNGKIEGVQDEVKGLLAVLGAQLPKNPATGDVLSSGINASNTTEAQRKAMWNYFLVLRDASNGIHNTSFTVQLLQKTYKELTGKDVPGAALR